MNKVFRGSLQISGGQDVGPVKTSYMRDYSPDVDKRSAYKAE